MMTLLLDSQKLLVNKDTQICIHINIIDKHNNKNNIQSIKLYCHLPFIQIQYRQSQIAFPGTILFYKVHAGTKF